MDPALRRAVETALAERQDGKPAAIVASAAAGGANGSVTQLETADGGRFFLKSGGPAAAFAAEARGLAALAAAGVFRVPVVVAQGASPPFLLLEAIEIGSPGPRFFEDFGRRLAELHRVARAERYGFDHDNFLGATPQPNGWREQWLDFWRDQRLGPLLALLRGQSDGELDRLGERLLDRLPLWLEDVGEAPSLLHGDLWAGNFLVGRRGEPVLLDPAVYYGHREADLAISRLFGGFPPAYFHAYVEAWPLEPGAHERGLLYELHHLLNHYHLFGAGYRGGCIERLKKLV
jgi:protein-ribulosamine 3-kinase